MNLLLALLAFAGIMAFLSTSMSIILEGIHKGLAWRRAGLEEVLRTLHDDVLTRLAGAGMAAPSQEPTKLTPDASRFARAMTENVSYGGRGRFWWLRNLPILSWLFQRRQEKLTTLQFVEGFARTDTGRRLQALEPAHLRRALTVAAYEFERYCDSQAAYFRRRAAVLSVVLAVAFAFVANIDAFYIFERLARDLSMAQFVAGATENEEGRTETRQAAASTAITETTQSAQVQQAAAVQARTAQQVADAGVPLGYMAFPYCLNNPVFIRAEDPRCGATTSRTPRDAPVSEILARAWERIATPGGGGLIWLLSVVVAGGLIGLGAPFWYDVFRRIARIVPAAQRVTGTVAQSSSAGPPSAGAQVVRDRGAANPNALVLAYRVASGQAAEAASSGELDVALDPVAEVAPGLSGGGHDQGVAFGGLPRIRRPL